MSARLGDYRLLRRLAQGGMGEVYLALLERGGGFSKAVALKTLLPSVACREDLAELFESEAQLAALLNHANIVQTFDHGCAEGRAFLTMEYVEGPDLARLLAAHGPRPFPGDVAAEIGVQALRGLAHAHARRDLHGRSMGVLHGDVSPSNILVTRDGQVKLADFGLARLRSAAAADGVLAGKLCYMSPEQASGEPLRPQSDLFALGLVLYELLTGVRAYPPREPTGAMLEELRAARIRPAGEACPELPAPAQAWLAQALAARPEGRFGQASEMGQALAAACPPCGPDRLAAFVASVAPAGEAAQAELPERTEVAARPLVQPPAPAPRVRRGTWLGLFGLCWGVAAAWWGLHTPPGPPPPPPPVPQVERPAPARLAPAALAAGRGLADSLPGYAAGAPAPAVRAPERPAQPVATGVLLSFPAALAAEVDHAPAAGARLRLDARGPHLVKLAPREPGAGSWEVLLRLSPPARAGAGWRVTVGSSPWMRIALQGRPEGQTPRTLLPLPVGKVELVLSSGQVRVPIELEVPAP
ncbi:MAG TPA: serine/threonine-protein kinase [Myxococcota bacterium]|nr:serine/threonine-protein kinase [Myxococcota bacterium]HRY94855.1 serine/threonine-protein kinase [Myxococcota bacterium]HSA23563.1 serine/threonine-protein kinase [Myxococcota bacterium]